MRDYISYNVYLVISRYLLSDDLKVVIFLDDL